MAAGEGFEPSQTESESVVLPLHNPATNSYIILETFLNVKKNLEIFSKFFIFLYKTKKLRNIRSGVPVYIDTILCTQHYISVYPETIPLGSKLNPQGSPKIDEPIIDTIC